MSNLSKRTEASINLGSPAVIVGAIIAILLLSGIFNILSGLIIPLLVWTIAGTIAGRILRGRGYGLFGDIGLGFVGGFIGNIALSLVGLGGLGDIALVGSVIAGVVGAIIFVFAVRLLKDDNFAR